MRVGLVCPYSFDVHGGVQNHVRELAGALVELGHHVEVLAPGGRRGRRGREPSGRLPAYVTTTGRAVAMPYNGSVARVSFGPLVAARVRRWLAAGRFDVLHIHEPATPSVSVLSLWAANVPVVATFHTAQERSRALETSAATLLRGGLGKIAAHIAVSDVARRTMSRYLDAEPVVIPNGVHIGRFAARPRDVAASPVVAFVGRLDEPRKGFPTLLEALPAVLDGHPEARVKVVGEGARPALLRELAPHLRRQVELCGPLSDDAKSEVLARADVVVAPNTHGESFGIVIVEAMAAGAAVVASDLPAFRAVLEDGRLGVLASPGDPGGLAAAICSLLADEALRRRLGASARQAARRYDWTAVAPRVAEVYAAAAHRPVGGEAALRDARSSGANGGGRLEATITATRSQRVSGTVRAADGEGRSLGVTDQLTGRPQVARSHV